MNRDNIEKLPKTVTKEVFICLHTGWNAGKFYCTDYDASSHGDYVLLGTQKVTFKIPQNIDVKGKVIEGLEAEKEKIQAAAHMKLKAVQEKIDNLLAIEYRPEEGQ